MKAETQPGASAKQLGTMLRRACPEPIARTPEGRLWLAMIELALEEAEAASASRMAQARRFLRTEGFERVCQMLGIEHGYAMALLRSHAAWTRGAAV